jgi:hypothetical protein
VNIGGVQNLEHAKCLFASIVCFQAPKKQMRLQVFTEATISCVLNSSKFSVFFRHILGNLQIQLSSPYLDFMYAFMLGGLDYVSVKGTSLEFLNQGPH